MKLQWKLQAVRVLSLQSGCRLLVEESLVLVLCVCSPAGHITTFSIISTSVRQKVIKSTKKQNKVAPRAAGRKVFAQLARLAECFRICDCAGRWWQDQMQCSLSLSAPLSVPLSLSATAILVAVFLFASFHSKYKVSGFVELSKEGEREGERD